MGPRIRALLILLLAALPGGASAGGYFCGSFDPLTTPAPVLRNVLETASLAVIAGPKETTCGLPGEDFRVCRACVNRLPEESWSRARSMLASESHRRWHYQWHRSFKEPNAPSSAEQAIWKKAGLLKAHETPEAFQKRLADHPGESFFFMHRHMIKMLQVELTALGLPCVSPWEQAPTDPQDPIWPQPRFADVVDELDLEMIEAEFRHVREWSAKFSDPKFLRGVSLNSLGIQMQSSLHIILHTVYGNRPSDLAKNCQGDEFLSRDCDDMGSDASSHVNPYFWKLHGYIDSFVGKWLAANGYRRIAADCRGQTQCYQWQGTYLGPLYLNVVSGK